MLQALYGDPLMEVSGMDIADDIVLLHHSLLTLQEVRKYGLHSHIRINLHNCGTAMRFLTAYCATIEGSVVELYGNPRMCHRPIGQEVEALRTLGADIAYLGKEGYPPLQIRGRRLKKHPIQMGVLSSPDATNKQLLSSQFVSALLLIGIEVQTDDPSPYIRMTRNIIEQYASLDSLTRTSTALRLLERDWSSAAFWYEHVALHGGTLLLRDLHPSSLQGDAQVAQLFEPLGVKTEHIVNKGMVISATDLQCPTHLTCDFSLCPDLYPAVAITCERLGITLSTVGTERLPYKESNRLLSVREHRTHHDHRIAMALMAADLPCDDQKCISKSYPTFVQQLLNHRETIVKPL